LFHAVAVRIEGDVDENAKRVPYWLSELIIKSGLSVASESFGMQAIIWRTKQVSQKAMDSEMGRRVYLFQF
jgi:hypothetical protein